MKKGENRAQVTLFIVIGVVLILFAAFAVFFLQPDLPGFEPVVQKQPLQVFTESCLKDTAKDALQRLGQQAGYLNLENKDTISFDPFSSDTLNINRQPLPYWYYQAQEGIDIADIPELEESDVSIQTQVESYIEKNLNTCLKDYEDFTSVTAGLIDIDVTFTDVDTIVTLNQDIERTQGAEITRYETFRTKLPVRIKKVYELAQDITTYQRNSLFLEDNTRNLISTYSRVDNEYLPPISGGLYFTSCHEKVSWQKHQVYEDFKDMLRFNIPYLKINNSKYERIIIEGEEREVRQGVYDRMIHTISDKTYDNLEVNFNYDNFPLYLDFGTSSLEPDTFELDLLLLQLCMFEYRFAYDVKYPVVVSITDHKSTIDEKPYVFQFPLQTVLVNNFPRLNIHEFTGFPEYDKDPDYQCSEEQRTSAESTITVNDELDDVAVYFQCGPDYAYEFNENGTVKNVTRFASRCLMGTTYRGSFTDKFPPCVGGSRLILNKDGYIESINLIGDVKEDVGFEKHVDLKQVKEINIEVKKYFTPLGTSIGVNDGLVTACNILQEPKRLQNNEQVMLKITKMDEGRLTTPPMYVIKPKEENKIKLAPGVYEIELMLIRDEMYPGEMTIKKNSQTISLPDKEIEYPDNDVELPRVFTGGAHFEWHVTEEDMMRNKVTMYVFDEGPPKRVEEINGALQHRIGCSTLNRVQVEPVFSYE